MNTLILYSRDTFRFKRYRKSAMAAALSPSRSKSWKRFAETPGSRSFRFLKCWATRGALLMLDEVAPLCRISRSPTRSRSTTRPSAFCPTASTRWPTRLTRNISTPGSTSRGTWASARARRWSSESGAPRACRRTIAASMDLLRSRGKTMIMYGDIILKYPEILDLEFRGHRADGLAIRAGRSLPDGRRVGVQGVSDSWSCRA